VILESVRLVPAFVDKQREITSTLHGRWNIPIPNQPPVWNNGDASAWLRRRGADSLAGREHHLCRDSLMASRIQRRIARAGLVATRTSFWIGVVGLLLCPFPSLPVGIAIALAAIGLLAIVLFVLGLLAYLTFALLTIRHGPRQRTDEHEPNRAPRLFQFTLRRVFVVITLTALAVVFAPKLWNARFTAPRRINVQMPGTLDLAGTTIQMPIRPESVESYYVWDGGTYGVRFVDDAGVVHVIGSWQPLGHPEHHGEIIIGDITPDSGGKNVGKIELAEQLIFSAMEFEDQSYQSEPTTMDAAYPTYGFLFTSVFRELGYRTGMW